MPDTIPAITVCQPFASLIALPDCDIEKKRTENRTWKTSYRGPFAIHAGASRKWLKYWHGQLPEPMPFSCVIAIAELVGCLPWPLPNGIKLESELEWIATHKHAEGPYIWILANVRRLAEPVPYRGALGLWKLPRTLITAGRPE